MPTYVYRDNADVTWEFDFPMGEAPDEFEDDNGWTYHRVYTSPAVHFRGSGFASKD